MYIVYDPTSGMIQQTISGPGDDYGDRFLTTRNLDWIFLSGAMNIDPRTNYVDVETKSICSMSAISIIADKMTFLADGVDCSKLTGIPLGSNVTVLCDNKPLSQSVSQDGEIEISSLATSQYKILIACWKYLPTEVILEAVSVG